MATDEIRIEGLDELERKLAEITDKKAAFKSLRSSLAKGARVVIRHAKAQAPADTGALRQSIGLFSRKGRGGSRVAAVFVGPKVKNKKALSLANAGRAKPVKGIFYGHMVELGTKHSRPQPFLRPALETGAGAALAVFAEDLRKKLEDVD